jgi:hypothetical protein
MNPDHNPDHIIDRVLQGLRDAKPPLGMDRRILNIREAEGSLKGVIPSEAKRSRGTPAFQNAIRAGLLRWIPVATAAAFFVAAIIVFATRHHKHPDTVSIASPIHQATPPTPAPSAFTAQPIQAHHTIPAHAKQISTQIETPSQPTQDANDAQLSHPAPPIPPTEQERLLLRYARRGNTNDLAQISNEKRADRDQKDAADFQAFFTPPEIPLGESE